MHRDFGEWYRLVSIEPDEERLQKRWAGVEEWVSILQEDDDSILETVRIFYGLPSKIPRENFLDAFRKHDAALAQRNELELRVLAGASLVACLQPDGDVDGVHAAVIAGTAVGTSTLFVFDQPLAEITDAILASLQLIASNQRKCNNVNTKLFETQSQASMATAFKRLNDADDWNTFKTHAVPAFQSLLGALRRSEELHAAAAHELRCSHEENNILWWLEGGCSRDLRKPWGALSQGAVPLIAAKELADLT